MAGTFTHLSVVNSICREGNTLDSISAMTDFQKQALRVYLKFVELGAVGPDCPLLHWGSFGATEWGNVMHYWRTTDTVREAIRRISANPAPDEQAKKEIAWLFGYVSHLVSDLTIHPVVELIVGPYEQNSKEHRICEMNQDSYIYSKVLNSEITHAEHIKNCGIKHCVDSSGSLDDSVSDLWSGCLSAVVADGVQMKDGLEAPTQPPVPADWHRWTVGLIDKFAEEAGNFACGLWQFPEDAGIAYPAVHEIKPQYIENLPTPSGHRVDFEEIFEYTKKNVINAWSKLADALARKDPSRFDIPCCDLDTGLIDSGNPNEGQLLYWSDFIPQGVSAPDHSVSVSPKPQKKKPMLTALAAIVALPLLILGPCIQSGPQPDKMKAAAGKLTTAIHGFVGSSEYAHLSDRDILLRVQELNPELKSSFSDFSIKFRRSGSHVIVLICTKDGRIALIEDSSRTAEIDKVFSIEEAREPVFTLTE